MIRTTTVGSEPTTFLAATAAGIVRQMKRTQWNAPARKGQYMAEVRERVQQMTGAWINVADHERFLRDLEAAGLITNEWDVLMQ